jgi:hypothetical protein
MRQDGDTLFGIWLRGPSAAAHLSDIEMHWH